MPLTKEGLPEENAQNNTDEVSVAESPLEAVEQFIAKRKQKKKASRKDGKDFTTLWLAAAREEGLKNSVCDALCAGFRFANARPLYLYCSGGETRESRGYEAIAYCPSIRNNANDIALRVYTSLLGCELAGKADGERIKWLIDKLVKTSKTKDGILSKNAPMIFRKQLLDVLPADYDYAHTVLPQLNKEKAGAFAIIVSEAMAELASSETNDAPKARALVVWAKQLAGGEIGQESAETPGRHASGAGGQRSLEDSCDGEGGASEQSGLSLEQVLSFIEEQYSERKRLEQLSDGMSAAAIDELKQELAGARDNVVKLSKSLDISNSENTRYRADLERIRGEKAKVEEKAAQGEAAIANLEEAFIQKEAELVGLKERITRLEEDLAASKTMAEMLSNRDKREEGEALKRIARALRADYSDFLETRDCEMSVEYGDILRDTLTDVFKVLVKNGIEIQG